VQDVRCALSIAADPPLDLTYADVPPFAWVPAAPDPDGPGCPEALRSRILIDVVHDGAYIPPSFVAGLDRKRIGAAFVRERDWGASAIAHDLAAALHVDGFARVDIARVLLDFNRFPGITTPFADHMNRFAINQPFASRLTHQDKRRILADYYDPTSHAYEAALDGKLIKVAIHTYDEHNRTQTRRPAVSILTRSHGHSRDHAIPVGLFDPLFPSELVELTCDPILRSRVALTLEEAAVHVADNYPYSLPEGSVEVRSQVWYFFSHVRRHYDAEHPRTPEEEADPTSPRNLVWSMLLDTNLRSAESDLLRSYLHMFRRPPERWRDRFEAARTEYEHVASFIDANRERLVEQYKDGLDRPSSIVIEVRKDLVYDFAEGRPIGPRRDDIRRLGRLLAKAVHTYLVTDRALKEEGLANRDPRFS
jgi:hypothetical protein